VSDESKPGETPNDDARLAALIGELSHLSTEQADTSRGDLDLLPTLDLVRAMNAEDRRVPEAIAAQAEHRRGRRRHHRALPPRRRLVYIGAGTAGRVGVLDASECPPTFGTDPGMVVGLIAGGETAIRDAVENAEDDDRAAAESLRALGLGENDTVVGISASGRTPYVLGGLAYAREAVRSPSPSPPTPDPPSAPPPTCRSRSSSGPEFVTGSTRLKAGTAQKLVVNMLSTLSMIRLGKTYRGVMVDLQATNESCGPGRCARSSSSAVRRRMTRCVR
jgi:N-acetylmuramic acid 6-phosphate etherase